MENSAPQLSQDPHAAANFTKLRTKLSTSRGRPKHGGQVHSGKGGTVYMRLEAVFGHLVYMRILDVFMESIDNLETSCL
eukprot:366466-Chlamydomonas_euryale.AAC.19